eukprot:GFKZ01012110.1.p1 GENE.GFKZ01012110.1~~GFKZ01012110.1.p1  ORF type:complete len:821 (+),score=130.85 GFKZ01012110.1:496-2958(+)
MRLRNVLHRRRSSNGNSSVFTLTVPKDELHLLTSNVGVAPHKEGTLLKYTNVVKRWKYRQFCLENGVLTYAAPHDLDRDSSDDSIGEAEPKSMKKVRRKLHFLKRQTSKDEKERDVKGSITLQFAAITADDSDPTRFAIDVGADVFHIRAESEAERNEWVDAMNASNEYFRGLIKTAVSRAQQSANHHSADDLHVAAEGLDLTNPSHLTMHGNVYGPDDSDDSILEDDGLKEAEQSRTALLSELHRILACWRRKWVQPGTVPEDGMEFLQMVAAAFKDRNSTSDATDHPANVSAKGLIDLVTWCLHVLQTNDELFERRMKADITRVMARGLPMFPTSPAGTASKMVASDEEEDDDDSDLEFFDALSRAASSRASFVKRHTLDERDSKARNLRHEKDADNKAASSDRRLVANEVKRVDTKIISKGFKGRRTRLPNISGKKETLNVFSILKDAVGKDLSKISIPIVLNEPISFLQRLAEDIEYSELLDKGAAESDPNRRMMYVAAMVISHYSSTQGRMGKPFNPLLGETACIIMPDKGKGIRFVAEQVSHHPPISACYAEGSGASWKYYNSIEIKNKFWGKSLEVFPTGLNHIEFPEYGDHYVLEQVTSCVHNIVIGTMWLDNYGEMEIVNKTNGGRCLINFEKTGWMSNSRSFGAIKGTVYDASGASKIKIGGTWTESVYEQLPGNKKNVIWRVADRPDEKASQSYNMTKWAISLNAPVRDEERPFVAPTDSRLRPDQRALENGEYSQASSYKTALEEGQRQRRRDMEAKGVNWEPRWFEKVAGEKEGANDYVFGGEFFKHQAVGDWTRCPDIFSCALENS